MKFLRLVMEKQLTNIYCTLNGKMLKHDIILFKHPIELVVFSLKAKKESFFPKKNFAINLMYKHK